EWAILDYKTGKVEPARKRNREWRDLQLPLYTLLAQELGLPGAPVLGHFAIGKDEGGTRVETLSDLDGAFETARDGVRRIRAGEFDEPGRLPDEPILLAIAGHGLVESEPEEEAE